MSLLCCSAEYTSNCLPIALLCVIAYKTFLLLSKPIYIYSLGNLILLQAASSVAMLTSERRIRKHTVSNTCIRSRRKFLADPLGDLAVLLPIDLVV